jgi:hypothetical protein
MFLGHFAVALGAKRLAPAVSLGTLFVCCQLADLIWPTLVLLGVERVAVDPGHTAFTPLAFEFYPYSHSLVALSVWAAVAGLIYRRATGAGLGAVSVLVLVVLSHWLLDVLSHRPDLPLTIRGETRLGAGLWNSVPGTLVLEGLLFAVGLWSYVRLTRARDRTGRLGLWLLVAVLVVSYLAAAFGPPPPSSAAVAWAAQAIWGLTLWALVVDRHRHATIP